MSAIMTARGGRCVQGGAAPGEPGGSGTEDMVGRPGAGDGGTESGMRTPAKRAARLGSASTSASDEEMCRRRVGGACGAMARR